MSEDGTDSSPGGRRGLRAVESPVAWGPQSERCGGRGRSDRLPRSVTEDLQRTTEARRRDNKVRRGERRPPRETAPGPEAAPGVVAARGEEWVGRDRHHGTDCRPRRPGALVRRDHCRDHGSDPYFEARSATTEVAVVEEGGVDGGGGGGGPGVGGSGSRPRRRRRAWGGQSAGVGERGGREGGRSIERPGSTARDPGPPGRSLPRPLARARAADDHRGDGGSG